MPNLGIDQWCEIIGAIGTLSAGIAGAIRWGMKPMMMMIDSLKEQIAVMNKRDEKTQTTIEEMDDRLNDHETRIKVIEYQNKTA